MKYNFWNKSVFRLSNIIKERKLDLTEKELVHRAQNGDLDAFKELVNQNESRIAATITGMIGRCPEAEDIGQETFIRFYQNINHFRAESSVATYLTRIAINLSLNELKRRKRKKLLFPNSTEEMLYLKDSDKNTEKLEINDALQKALVRLKPKYKKVIVLRLVSGYTTRETAELLSLPEGTVLSRLARGLKKLKQELQILEN
ncbi:sigma-70 family RNA polymerase sigma factor [candidate division KSB1 bacterium]|nr:sigma-70 family RNA polymerase sigma factor [candidate division KSB1 bacterium]